MPKLTIIEQAQYQRMPWKNGLGETLEIQRHEDESGLRFRISQASVVEDGVFSDFSGLNRTLVLLSGEGMTLEHKSETGCQINKLDSPLDIARFSGGDTTYATLKNGKIEDLNIMVRDDDTQARVQACTAPCSIIFADTDTLFCGFYASEGSVIEMENANTAAIKAHSMAVFSQNAKTTLTQGRGVLVCIRA
ncbi:HutD/Ves family protein [Marinomonas shanghaiensis]|uniref:HutD/Ves family protein n=1 Tax=Marinomonas shanghaiensis TaxID=2202418 RepID=UPI000DBA76CC|nr:HutD family protein [Marinomonas shanghaiensis]